MNQDQKRAVMFSIDWYKLYPLNPLMFSYLVSYLIVCACMCTRVCAPEYVVSIVEGLQWISLSQGRI